MRLIWVELTNASVDEPPNGSPLKVSACPVANPLPSIWIDSYKHSAVQYTVEGVTELISGKGAGFTVTVAEAVALPSAPVQVSVYVAVAEGVSVTDPLVASVPDHAPDAVQDVVFVELHASVVVLPAVMVEGDAVSVAVGGCAAGGFTVTVADPATLVYPGTVDAAVIVAVVIAIMVEEAVNFPVASIVPALAGLADHVTA